MIVFDVDAAAIDALALRETQSLRAQGVEAGESVGWLALNQPRALALLAACERIGARYVPLNWRLGVAELARCVEHAGLQWLLHDDAMRPLAEAILTMQRVDLPLPQAPGHVPGDVMLVYTSGTGGNPKGAIHTSAGMRANIAAAIDAQHLDAQTRTLAVLPLFHVGGLCIQVLPTLAAGGCVRLHARFDAGAWLRDVAAWRPTTSLLVPATMRALVEHPGWADADLRSLAFVNSGSQTVPRELIDAFHQRGVRVCQVYGATETGPVSLVLRPEEALRHPGKAGRPALGVDVRCVDGELWIRGPNLARGYHREPDSPAFADGWFHSGDLAIQSPDGLFEIVGRCNELIISGGENIHPTEIENLALGDATVAEAAVVGLPDKQWGEVPVLAVVARPGAVVDVARLAAVLADGLARFKQPRHIVVLPELPKTALGKVQRARLAEHLSAMPLDETRPR